MSIRSVLNNLDLILSKKDMIIKRHDIGSIIIKEAGICGNNHIPFTLENLVRLWTEDTRWTISKNEDTIYLYKIKTKNNKFNILGFGWSKCLQRPITLQNLSYNQLFKDAIKVGVRLPNSTVHIDDVIEVLRDNS